jgi:hypothetical protein
MGQDTGLTLQINSREQLVTLLQGIFDTTQTTAATGTEEIVDVLEVDDYDYGNFEDADDEDYERLVELLGNLKQSFGEGRTDDLINLLFEDEEESETRVSPLGATQKLRQIDRLILFFKTPSPETESAFNEAIRALPPWKLPKLSEILELRQKELNPEDVVSATLLSASSSNSSSETSSSTATTAAIAEGSQVVSSPSTISFYSDVFSRSIKAVNALIAEKGKDELNPPVGLLSRGGRKPTGDVIGRVLGISKVAKSSSISATIGFGSGIVSSLSNPDNRNAAPVTAATSDPHQVLEKYSRFGRKVTKQNLIEAGLFAADQPDNPIELKWSDIDTVRLFSSLPFPSLPSFFFILFLHSFFLSSFSFLLSFLIFLLLFSFSFWIW